MFTTLIDDETNWRSQRRSATQLASVSEPVRSKGESELKSVWIDKRDPERHPVRFLAGIWQEHTGVQLTARELGQLRDLRRFLGDFTPHVIEWMLDPVHWWRFCQHVQSQSGLRHVPERLHIGFLLKHRNRALNFIRAEARHSTAAADLAFCAQLDQRRSNELRSLLVVLSGGQPDWLATIDAACTLWELKNVFGDLTDMSTGGGER